MSKNAESPLLAAARVLCEDLERFDKLSGDLSRAEINSDKTLQRAARVLLEIGEHETKLADSLRAFAAAMQGMQATQQRCVEQTALATQRVRERQAQRAQLLERLSSLSLNAGEIGKLGVSVSDAPAAVSSDLLRSLQEVTQRLELVIAEASAIVEQARADDWSDLERDTLTLKQQLLAAKNRLVLNLSKLAKEASS